MLKGCGIQQWSHGLSSGFQIFHSVSVIDWDVRLWGNQEQSLIRWNSIRFPWKCKCLMNSLLMQLCCFFFLLQRYLSHGFAGLQWGQHWGQFKQHHYDSSLLGHRDDSENQWFITDSGTYTLCKPWNTHHRRRQKWSSHPGARGGLKICRYTVNIRVHRNKNPPKTA